MALRNSAGFIISLGLLTGTGVSAQTLGPAETEMLESLATEQPYHTVSSDLFNRFGWDIPDAGAAVKELAEAAPGGAIDPHALEKLPVDKTGYRASWHEHRYEFYGVEWDITGLLLTPQHAVAGMPTMVVIHGGSSNWYEFFVDPMNNPGLGQYLAQKVPVLLVTIPGNYRHGGWGMQPLADRLPRYLLDQELSSDEIRSRNAAYTFQLVAEGLKQLVEKTTKGPIVMIAHSTAGELPFMLHHSSLKDRMNGWILGWGSGGTSSQKAMQDRWGYTQTVADYPPVWELRARPTDEYTGPYLGPLNPVWEKGFTREQAAQRWMGEQEFQRRPHFKQPLQDIERRGLVPGMREAVTRQVRETLQGNEAGIDTDAVIADLYAPMRVPLSGYSRMIWTAARLDTGHWNPENVEDSSTLQVANEFRKLNPQVPARAVLFDVEMTHYGHIERPKQLAAGLYTTLTWLVESE
jgi:hypothetical protein